MFIIDLDTLEDVEQSNNGDQSKDRADSNDWDLIGSVDESCCRSVNNKLISKSNSALIRVESSVELVQESSSQVKFIQLLGGRSESEEELISFIVELLNVVSWVEHNFQGLLIVVGLEQ